MVAVSSPYAPTPSLLTSLQRAGWGDLNGADLRGPRHVLIALVSRLPFQAGQGFTTIEQVAASAGYSTRWTARCMALLEDLGVIEWTRGGVYKGSPRPSWVRIVKRVLIELIAAARPQRTAAEREHAAKTNARIAHLRWVRGRSRRSGHMELSASPPTPRGEATTPSLTLAGPDDLQPMPEHVRALLMRRRT